MPLTEGLAVQMQRVWSGDGPQRSAPSGSTWLQGDGCSEDMSPSQGSLHGGQSQVGIQVPGRFGLTWYNSDTYVCSRSL